MISTRKLSKWRMIWCILFHKHRHYDDKTLSMKCNTCHLYYRQGSDRKGNYRR